MSISSPNGEKFESEPGQPYYRKFDLADLGVDKEAFLEHVRPIYYGLDWDEYDVIRGGLKKTTRQRALAEFKMEYGEDDWSVRRVPAKPYQQSTNHGAYVRTLPRFYPEAPKDLTPNNEVLTLQKAVANIVRELTNATRLRIIFTFLRTIEEEGRTGQCALEGEPHIDGMDYIASALVINRGNLLPHSGESSVWSMNNEKLMSTVLLPGELILQDDKNLKHHITNISRDVPNIPGIRDILGIDVEILNKPYARKAKLLQKNGAL